MNRVNDLAIHRCINEGYGSIQIFTEKYGFPPRNCGVSATCLVCHGTRHSIVHPGQDQVATNWMYQVKYNVHDWTDRYTVYIVLRQVSCVDS